MMEIEISAHCVDEISLAEIVTKESRAETLRKYYAFYMPSALLPEYRNYLAPQDPEDKI